MAYETEVFCECGSWSNLTEMEESLLLMELMELYDTTVERQTRLIHAIASMFGGSSGGSHSGSENNTVVVYGEEDLSNVPFGLGYESQ